MDKSETPSFADQVEVFFVEDLVGFETGFDDGHT